MNPHARLTRLELASQHRNGAAATPGPPPDPENEAAAVAETLAILDELGVIPGPEIIASMDFDKAVELIASKLRAKP
jgi:hypothetical protein